MEFYRALIFPLLARLDPEWTHLATLRALELAQATSPGRVFLRRIAGFIPPRPIEIAGLTFPNPLGVAAGFDKDARVAAGLGLLGFGHIEVGTLTPRPQIGNPRPRIFRLMEDQALINRMGFPSAGVLAVLPRLKKIAAHTGGVKIGVSLGKQKETPLMDAAGDYIDVMGPVYEHADYLAVNISSPNTPGLRDLQSGSYLDGFLGALLAESSRLARQKGVTVRPLFLKVSPDLEADTLKDLVAAALDLGVAGFIATNTTTNREGITGPFRGQPGGLSGRPLAGRSTAIVGQIHDLCAGRLPIIAAGGVQTAADVRDKLAAGASLVQIYTGLVYQGPGLAGRLLRTLEMNENREKIG